MRKHKLLAAVFTSALLGVMSAFTASAAFNVSVENAYNKAVQAQDALDGLDVSVEERTISSLTNIDSSLTTDLKVSGIGSAALYADITITADEDSSQNYYRNGYYYEQVGAKKIRVPMDRAQIWNKINSLIYLDMNSKDLTMLYSQPQADGNVIYYFAADEDSLGEYAYKLLDAYSSQQGAVIENLQGSMIVDAQGHVLQRDISLIYSVDAAEGREIFHKNITAKFRQDGAVTISLPDLSAYQDPQEDKPVVKLTPCSRTVYALADLNVRSAGSLEAAIIGGYTYASGMTETAYTSDGWIQIQYNGGTGYVFGELVGTEQPVTTKDSNGVMYATCVVNIRSSWNSESQILGVLSTGDRIDITGTTSNGWTRVRYNGAQGYVYSEYLTWSEPVDPNYVENAMMYGPLREIAPGMLRVERPDGTDILFNITYAALDLMDSLEVGDMLQIVFSGSGEPYTASKIKDTTVHSRPQPEMGTVTMDGIVAAIKGTTMELSCMDGVYRTFELGDAAFKIQDPLKVGSYIVVKWKTNNMNQTKKLKAIEIS